MRQVRRWTLTLTVAALLALGGAGASSAHNLGPCNDADEDGSPSGREYAAHHIVPLAHAGELGAGGHVPGSHRGFSLCDPANR
jgi:hypothetical protein